MDGAFLFFQTAQTEQELQRLLPKIPGMIGFRFQKFNHEIPFNSVFLLEQLPQRAEMGMLVHPQRIFEAAVKQSPGIDKLLVEGLQERQGLSCWPQRSNSSSRSTGQPPVRASTCRTIS